SKRGNIPKPLNLS
nr:Chain C, Cyclin-dependent kinase inhibitor FAR1 [synthetic construct]